MTAEISTMRLDMGDMQEALMAHDAWMEDVSQSLYRAGDWLGLAAVFAKRLKKYFRSRLVVLACCFSWC